MTFNQIKMAIYATYLTNYYGFKMKKKSTTSADRKRYRIEYARKLLEKMNLHVKVINPEKIPEEGKYLLVSNHRSVIDPLIVELATEQSNLFGYWIAKKELYNSFFFGTFTRNAGTILIDRESKQMGGFFADIKERVAAGDSIFIFPEGTRNKKGTELEEFKEGSRLIAVKNRLPMLPVFIRTQANDILKAGLKDPKTARDIEIVIGDIIDYKDKTPLEESYKKQFDIK